LAAAKKSGALKLLQKMKGGPAGIMLAIVEVTLKGVLDLDPDHYDKCKDGYISLADLPKPAQLILRNIPLMKDFIDIIGDLLCIKVKVPQLKYPDCRDGYEGNGPVCWEKCRNGYGDGPLPGLCQEKTCTNINLGTEVQYKCRVNNKCDLAGKVMPDPKKLGLRPGQPIPPKYLPNLDKTKPCYPSKCKDIKKGDPIPPECLVEVCPRTYQACFSKVFAPSYAKKSYGRGVGEMKGGDFDIKMKPLKPGYDMVKIKKK